MKSMFPNIYRQLMVYLPTGSKTDVWHFTAVCFEAVVLEVEDDIEVVGI